MKRKKFFWLPVIFAVFLAACAGAPKAENPAENVAAEEPDDIVIDWRGRNVGAERPAWASAVAQGDPYEELSRLPRVNGRKTTLMQQDGANLEVLQAWVNTSAYAECAEQIKATAISQSGTVLTGDLDSPEAENLLDQFRGLYARATITGLERVLDTWIKTRSRTTGAEKYSVYAVYAISEDDLKASIAETFGRIEARNAQQEELRNRIQSGMENLIAGARF
ncbi:MAG: hypothetical protein LBI85_04090 [Spirochaetaceae bacterium]|jgi:hypothetical protein|nr:hypothetical protein [Spirochaetaceae bacterium]